MRLSRRAVLVAAAAVLVPIGLVAAPSAPAAGPVFGKGAPAYVYNQAPSSFLNADFAGEPSIGVNWRTGHALYMAGTSTYRLDLNAASQPATIGWSDVSSIYSANNLDPILATDPTTGVTLAGGDNGPCAVMSKTADDGASWSPVLPCALATDHPTVGFGPFAGTPPLGSSGSKIAYFCQQQDVGVCARSLDGGSTWLPGVPETGCAGLFGHIQVGPDGTAYVPSVNCVGGDGNIEVGGFSSADNGVSWTSYGIPGAARPVGGFDPSVAITPDSTLYETWARAGDFHPVVSSSATKGLTWSPQVDLAGTVNPPIVASAFETAVAGDNGRLAVAFLGTQVGTAGVSPYTSGYHGVWDLYVSHSYDGGTTWTTTKVTSTPVQRGSISDGGTTSLSQRNLLDFIGASVTKDGRVVVAYADGCNGACDGPAGTEAQSMTDQYASAALQTSGKGLFAAYDVP